MEKLQQALQSARAKRGDPVLPAEGGTIRPASPALRTPGAAGASGARGAAAAAAAWDSLRVMTPDQGHLVRNRVLSSAADPAAVPFDVLRTKIRMQMEKNGWKRLAITSPSPSCGKTTIACNLAMGFGRQTDMRVMLFEFDLRRPNMDKVLGITPPNEITRMLSGEVPFAEQALRIQDSVAISLAGRAAPDPGTLLLSQRTLDTLAEVDATYKPDLMIFDLPPLLVIEDARAFLRHIDCVLLVAAADRTTTKELDVCEREIAEYTNVLGVVLNQCRHLDESVGYGDYGYYS